MVGGSGKMLIVKTGAGRALGRSRGTGGERCTSGSRTGNESLGILILRLTLFLTLFVLLAHLVAHTPRWGRSYLRSRSPSG